MKWTSKLPSADGYYWRRNHQKDIDPEIVEVCIDTICFMGLDDQPLAASEGFEFYGPLNVAQAEPHNELVEALAHALVTKHDIRTCACVPCEDARKLIKRARKVVE